MPIEQIFEKKEDAPEFLQSALLETEDGKFKFQAELPQEVGGLKSALSSERKARSEYEARLKKFDNVDLEKYQSLIKSEEDAKAQKARAVGDWEAREFQLKAQLEADLQKREVHYSSEITARDTKISMMKTALEQSLITAEATAAITAAKGTPELLLPHIMKRVQIVEEDGNFNVRVIDKNGQPRIADIKGTPFTIRHLVDELKADAVFGRAFEASGAGGSGAYTTNKTGGNTAKTISRASFDALSATAKMDYIKAKGQISD